MKYMLWLDVWLLEMLSLMCNISWFRSNFRLRNSHPQLYDGWIVLQLFFCCFTLLLRVMCCIFCFVIVPTVSVDLVNVCRQLRFRSCFMIGAQILVPFMVIMMNYNQKCFLFPSVLQSLWYQNDCRRQMKIFWENIVWFWAVTIHIWYK